MQTRFSHWKKILTVIFAVCLMWACNRGTGNNESVPVAKVGEKILYLSDMMHIFNKGINKKDSLAIAQAYIDNWIKTQLILKKAELNLTETQLDISAQLENYRSSLLIYKYEEQMIRDKVDTTITRDEIQKYYDQNTANFILDANIVKALFVKVPLAAPNIPDLKAWYRSDVPDDSKKLEKYCFTNATKFSRFNDEWVSFSYLSKELPQGIENEDDFLKNNRYYETQDAEYLYLVRVYEAKYKGEVAPVDFVKMKIKDIVLNKRKLSFISDLEKNIYNDAADHSNFKIYNLDKK